jgi:hypothetical protein
MAKLTEIEQELDSMFAVCERVLSYDLSVDTVTAEAIQTIISFDCRLEYYYVSDVLLPRDKMVIVDEKVKAEYKRRYMGLRAGNRVAPDHIEKALRFQEYARVIKATIDDIRSFSTEEIQQLMV